MKRRLFNVAGGVSLVLMLTTVREARRFLIEPFPSAAQP
jgi:hypothetical protein